MNQVKPLGKDETVQALLDAADLLFGEKGPNSVTVRDISASANVNHALLHRHFGSKEALLSEIIDRHRLAFVADIKSADGVDAAIESFFANMLERPAFPRIFAHLILDHRPVEEFVNRAGGTRMLADVFAGKAMPEQKARQVASMLTAFSLGWALFKNLATYAAGCEDSADDADDAALQALVAMIETSLADSSSSTDAPKAGPTS